MGSVVTIVAYPSKIIGSVAGNVIAIAVGVSVIAAGIAVGVVITKMPLSTTGGSSSSTQHETVVLQSTSSLVFDRTIEISETNYFYNATEALFTLVQELSDHLQREFPDTFIKVIVSGFSSTPVLVSKRRKRITLRDILCEKPGVECQRNKTSVPSNQTTPSTSTNESVGSSSTMTTKLPSTLTNGPSETSIQSTLEPSYSPDISWLSSLLSTTSKLPPTFTHVSTDRFSTESTTNIDRTSTESYSSSDSSTNILSTFTSLFSSFTSTISLQTTTEATTTSENIDYTNCIISQFNGTSHRALIYINGTLYFNTTMNKTITVTSIVNALGSFTPLLTLINKCRHPSSAEGTFNAVLSKVEPAAVVSLNDTSILTGSSIPATIVNEVQTVTIPETAFGTVITTALPMTSTTAFVG